MEPSFVLSFCKFRVAFRLFHNQRKIPIIMARAAAPDNHHGNLFLDLFRKGAVTEVLFSCVLFEFTKIASGFVETVLYVLLFKLKKEKEIAGIVCQPGLLPTKTYF